VKHEAYTPPEPDYRPLLVGVMPQNILTKYRVPLCNEGSGGVAA